MTENNITSADIKKAYIPAAAVAGAMIIISLCYGAAAIQWRRLNIESPIQPPAAYALKYAFYLLSAAAFAASRFFTAPRVNTSSAGKTLLTLARYSFICSALAEIPAFAGLTLFILTGFFADFMLLFAFSLIMAAAYFPRLQAWQHRLIPEFSVAPREGE